MLGVDGPWIDHDQLLIPEDCFLSHDLQQADLRLQRVYDLVLCLEVAEHLSPQRAESLVSDLARLGWIILFSAAIPGQGGLGHLNEQWPNYWVTLFSREGFEVYDFIRHRIWSDEHVGVQYRQNTLLFVQRDRVTDLALPTSSSVPLPIVHPDLFSTKVKELSTPSLRRATALFFSAVRRKALFQHD